MKVHTTNYVNTFIEVAPDCPVKRGTVPPLRNEKKSVAYYQYELLINNPYKFTSDDVLFQVFAIRNGLNENEAAKERESFFLKGKPCFRASPLTKNYGWGVHSNAESKIAIFAMESEQYKELATSQELKIVKAMKSNR